MQKKQRRRSIQNRILFTFTLVLLVCALGIGTLLLVRWYQSSEQTISLIESTIANQIQQNVASFLDEPMHLNKMSQSMVGHEVFCLTDELARDRFFLGVLLSSSSDIYSFSYGTEEGHYYGARRNSEGVVEIMRNNESTQGYSWYYEVLDDLRSGERVVQAGRFDPRTRVWYQAAKDSGVPTFSPLYKHFVMDDLTISAALPVYRQDGVLHGVLGTHMLLSSLGTYLQSAVTPYEGTALIIERKSGLLVGNSMNLSNFTADKEGNLQRTHISDLSHSVFERAYSEFTKGDFAVFLQSSRLGNVHVRIQELQLQGVDWLLVTSVPHSLLFSSLYRSISLSVFLILLYVLFSIVLYRVMTKKMLRPLVSLLDVADAITKGDLDRRVPIFRDDELGQISDSLNRVADKMRSLIDNLEENVFMRTEQLYESQSQLRLILDSTAEGIYGMDLQGKCTFINNSALRILGYEREDEFLGKDIHPMIHHNHDNSTGKDLGDCTILAMIQQGRSAHAEDEQFYRMDGSSFAVAYYAFPQKRNDRVIGGVVSFMDITKRKQWEDEIAYLGSHDPLTGLYNRQFFETFYQSMNTQANYPIAVIFADINALKLTNDVFGHDAGDNLILKSAEILQRCCRSTDLIARIGGDEFAMLMPNTDEKEVEKLMQDIVEDFSSVRVEAIQCSIALGYDIQTDGKKALKELMANAEDMMYIHKSTNRKNVHEEILNTLVQTLFDRCPKEEIHAKNVQKLCVKFARHLKLVPTEASRLERVALLHDVGKVSLDKELLHQGSLDEEDYEKIRQHPVVGFRILNLFDATLDLAPYVYSHHERWDGNGYPQGLSGTQIPPLARMIAIIEAYERIVQRNGENALEAALCEIRMGAGTQFDPDLACDFIAMMQNV